MQNKQRLSPPLRQVFRAAFAARDSRLAVDARNEEGERIVASRRANARTAITEQALKREVSLDLEMLMNTVAFEASSDLTGLPLVRRSILNYGLPDIGARTIDEASVAMIAGEVRAALQIYEPRLDPRTITVTRDETVKDGLRIRFGVHAELLCDPVAVPVEFVADIDTETNTFHVLTS